MTTRNGPSSVRAVSAVLLSALSLSSICAAGEPELRWSWAEPGPSVGRFGFDAIDVDADGSAEILASGCDWDCWILFGLSGAGYAQRAASLPAEVFKALTYLPPGPGHAAGVVATTQSELLFFHGFSPVPTLAVPISGSEAIAIEVADIDADGDLEILRLGLDELGIFEAATGAPVATRFGFGGEALDLGQIDADAPSEIGILSTTGSIWVLDGASLQVQWAQLSGADNALLLVDVTGDALDEVVYFDPTSFEVVALDPRTGGNLYAVVLGFNPIRLLSGGDVTGDGIDEVLAAEDDSGQFHALAGPGGVELWSMEHGNQLLFGLEVADSEGDGAPDLFWATGSWSDYDANLRVADAATRELTWESLDLRGGYFGLQAGDIDADGVRDVVAASAASGRPWGPGRFLRYRGRDGVLLSASGQLSEFGVIWDLQASQTDDDEPYELFAAGEPDWPHRGAAVACVDGRSAAEEWRLHLYTDFSVSSMRVGDVDADGSPDTVVIGSGLYGPIDGPFVFAFDSATGWLKWRSADLGSAFFERQMLELVDLDGDGLDESVIAAFKSTFAVVSGVDGATTTFSTPELGAVMGADVIGDAAEEVVAARGGTGELGIVDASTGNWSPQFGDFGDTILGLAFADFLEGGGHELLFVADGRLTAIEPETSTVLWQGPPMGLESGYALTVGDVDGDGLLEAVVNTGSGIAAFGFPYQGDELFIDGFETGDTAGWSRLFP